MRVLAINSSPKMDKGNTALILNPFLEGMRGAGAVVELFYTRKLNINPCSGELDCLLKTPGECYQNDDMNILNPKLREVDILVFATPVYVDGVTGPMKTLLDRMLPLKQPFYELIDGHCRVRQSKKYFSKVALVSTCGYWEMDNFNPLLVHMKAFCKNSLSEFAGALLRPHGGWLGQMVKMGMPIDDIFKAAREAGRQLVEDDEISSETLNIVSREIMPLDIYVQNTNQGFQQAIEALKKK